MSYKIKSFIYLICFVSSAILYYNMDQEFNPLSNSQSAVVAKADGNKTTIENKVETIKVQ